MFQALAMVASRYGGPHPLVKEARSWRVVVRVRSASDLGLQEV